MADIDIIVNSSQVKSAKQELLELGNSFNSASKSASIFMQAFERAAKQSQRDEQYITKTSLALRNLINNNMKITTAYKSAEQSASAFTEQLRKQEAQAVKTARANQEVINKQLGVGGPSAVSQGAGSSAIGGEIERLRMKYDQIYASSNLYEKSLAELNRAHMLGVTSTKQHEAAVASLNLEYQNFQSGVAQAGNRFSQHVNQSASGMNKFGVAAQQTGYQVSDFIVQVQGGTNPLVAFSQQATQLAGLLYLLPPALQASSIKMMGFSISLATVFASVTILIPLLSMLAMAFFKSGKEAKDTATLFRETEEALSDLTEVSSDFERISSSSFRVAKQEATSFLEVLRSIRSEKLNTALEEALSSTGISQALEELNASVDSVFSAEAMSGAGRSFQEIQASAYETSRIFGLTANEAARLDSILKGVGGTTKEEVAASFFEAVEKIKEANLLSDQTKTLIDQIASGLGLVEQAYEEVDTVASSIYATLRDVALVDLSQPFANAMPAAQTFLDKLREMASAYATYGPGNVIPGTATPYGEFREDGMSSAARGVMRDRPNPFGTIAGGAGGISPPTKIAGGGGGGSEPSESMLEKLQKQLDIEKELLGTTETYQRVRSALGEDFVNTSPKIIEGLMQQATEIENLTRLEEERQSLMDSVNGTLETGFMAMVKGTKTVGEAFRDMAAAILEELFRVLVVQKLVAGFTGSPGGVGIGGLFGGGRASGGSMMAGQSYLVGEQGPEIVVPRHSGTVVNANQTAGAMAGSGGFTQNLSINVTGSDAAMVRQEVAKMIPQITNATKAAVIDAKQRGGQMAQAFR